jgi:Ca2+-binding EF-hand superfamily protein
MKSAKSKAMWEDQQKEGLRQLLADEVALRAIIEQKFAEIDRDNDGFLSIQDAGSLVKHMDSEGKGEGLAELLLSLLDCDRDGKVSIADYHRHVVAYLRHAANS